MSASDVVTTGQSLPLSELIKPILEGRRGRVLLLSLTAWFGALAEASVLVGITQIAFALVNDQRQVKLSVGPMTVDWTVNTAIAITLLLVLVRGTLQVLNGWQSTQLVSGYLASARKDFSSAFLHTSLSEQTMGRGGELQELLTSFVNQGASTVNVLSQGVTAFCSLLALLFVAVAVSPVAALGLLLTVGLLGLSILPLRKVIAGPSRQAADSAMEFAATVSEFNQLIRETRVFGVEREVEQRLGAVIDDYSNTARRLQFLSFLFTPLYATFLLLILVVGLASVRVMNPSNLSALGAVMLVMIRSLAYAQLAQGVFAQLHSVSSYLSDLSERLDAMRREAVDPVGHPIDGIGLITAENVCFEYVPGTRALTDVTFSIKRGEIIGIVGPSGSGKSTLVQLLLRMRVPTSGTISADGLDINTVELADWRKYTTFVPQDSRLIHGTVAENIRFYRPEFTDTEVVEAADKAQIRAEVESWADGFDHHVGDAGGAISGGQRQRICIARALLSKPQLLIMDEPTSALDVQSEARIRDSISDLRGSTTVIIIAHRLSTLDICDRIMVIQDGQLKSFDTPERLGQTDTFYRDALELSGLK